MQSIPLQPPYLGVNERLPVAALEEPYAERLLNFNVSFQGLKLRNGDSKYKNIPMAYTSGGAYCPPILLAPYGNTALFMATYNGNTNKVEIYDVDAGTISYTSGPTGVADIWNTLYFNKYIYFFGNSSHSPGYAYSGSGWGAVGFTGSGTFTPFGGCSFKRRAYLIQYGEAAFWYGGIDAVSGTTTKVDLSSEVFEKCNLSQICPITLSGSSEPADILAFVFDNGEVLFYSGSYPDSPSWQRVGRAKLSQPITYTSLPYKGDSIVLTDSGPASLRALFQQGITEVEGFSGAIQRTWRLLVQTFRTTYDIKSGPLLSTSSIFLATSPYQIRGVFDSKSNRLHIHLPIYLDSNGAVQKGSFYFVYDSELKCWFFHQSEGLGATALPMTDIAFFANKLLAVGRSATKVMIWEKEGSTGYTDRYVDDDADQPFGFEAKFAPLPIGRKNVAIVNGIDPIIKSDLYSNIQYRLVSDLGSATTSAQTIPDMGSSVRKVNVNLSAEGNYVQVKMSGQTAASKTVGLEIYGVNVNLVQGASPR